MTHELKKRNYVNFPKNLPPRIVQKPSLVARVLRLLNEEEHPLLQFGGLLKGKTDGKLEGAKGLGAFMEDFFRDAEGNTRNPKTSGTTATRASKPCRNEQVAVAIVESVVNQE